MNTRPDLEPGSRAISWIDHEIEQLAAAGLWRELAVCKRSAGSQITIDGQELINFGSNDYLGLAADPRLAAAVTEQAEQGGWGSGASPLVCGRHELHAELEKQLAEFEGTEAALLFASGFAANAGTIPALVDRGDVIFADEKNHASLIDGCRLARAEVQVFSHGDCDQLATQLKRAGHFRRCLIVTDSLFSMDGDLAPLVELAELAGRYDAMLMVDEAHATGVFGRLGRGVAEHLGVEDAVDVRIGTLSKALGCAGGFVCGSSALIRWLANRARTYVFSTAPPVAGCAAALAALEIVRNEPQRREELLARSETLRKRLVHEGWKIGRSSSQIIPLLIGSPDRAMQISRQLREKGFFVPGIRPPSVPAGESLLRLSLTFGHALDWVDRLVAALGDLHRR